MLKELGCFPDDRTFSLEETSFAEAFPGPESFGRRDADVALVAGRFKANIESLLQLYPEILAKHPELFDGSDIDLKSFALLGPDSKQGNGNLTVPTAAAGNARSVLSTDPEVILAHAETAGPDPDGEDETLAREFHAAQGESEKVSRQSTDPYASSSRTQALNRDLADKEVVLYLMYYAMYEARLGIYSVNDEASVHANLQSLHTDKLAWWMVDVHDDEQLRRALHVTPERRAALQLISQDTADRAAKNPEWLTARCPMGINRITGSNVERARNSQPSYLKSVVGVAPDGTKVHGFKPTEAMQYGTVHEPDAFKGVVSWFSHWFEHKYCPENGIVYSECTAPAFEDDLGLFVYAENEVFAYSPDGRITVVLPDGRQLQWLVEIKCPSSKMTFDTQSELPILKMHTIKGVEGKQPIPSNYYSQVQLGMRVMDLPATIFAVWTQKYAIGTKESVQVQIIDRNDDFTDEMLEGANDFFWSAYVPRLRQLKDSITSAQAAAGSNARTGLSPAKKRNKRAMTEDEKSAMEHIHKRVVLCADGAPCVIAQRYHDVQREAGGGGGGGGASPPTPGDLAPTEVSAGGFHFGKECYTMVGREYQDVFLRELISRIRPYDGQQKWFLEPPDPRQREAEEAEYMMGVLLALVHECVQEQGNEATEVTWLTVHSHLLSRCREKVNGPFAYKVTEWLRQSDISFLVRDSERRVDPYDGWVMFKAAHRLARSTLFTNNNAHKYVRLGCDEQVSMDTRSELMDVVYGKVIFLEVTANGVTIFRGND